MSKVIDCVDVTSRQTDGQKHRWTDEKIYHALSNQGYVRQTFDSITDIYNVNLQMPSFLIYK